MYNIAELMGALKENHEAQKIVYNTAANVAVKALMALKMREAQLCQQVAYHIGVASSTNEPMLIEVKDLLDEQERFYAAVKKAEASKPMAITDYEHGFLADLMGKLLVTEE